MSHPNLTGFARVAFLHSQAKRAATSQQKLRGSPVRNSADPRPGRAHPAPGGAATHSRAAEGGRFAHFAGLTLPVQLSVAAAVPVASSPWRRPTQAELRCEMVANGGRVPGCDTPEQAAAFVHRAAAKASAPGKPRALGKPNMDTPEGMAAFILSAGKRTGAPR